MLKLTAAWGKIGGPAYVSVDRVCSVIRNVPDTATTIIGERGEPIAFVEESPEEVARMVDESKGITRAR